MTSRKGFTLIEIIVVMVIIGILAAVAIPNYTNMIQQGAVKASQYNLETIYNAQKIYYFNNGQYCLTNSPASTACAASTGDNNCADNLTAIICNLGLNISDSFGSQYQCLIPPLTPNAIVCSSVNPTIPTYSANISITQPIILKGGTGCVDGYSNPCNPNCVPAGASFCP